MPERTPRNQIVGALAAPDPRWKSSNIRSKTAPVAASDYTEQGPHAGRAVPLQGTPLVLKTAGGQTADGTIRIMAQQGGLPLPDESSFLWQEFADDAFEWQGGDGYQAATGWEGLVHSTAGIALLGRPSVIRLQSGELLSHDASNETNQNFRVYDPKLGGWTLRTSIAVGAFQGGQALLQLPSGKILFFYIVLDRDQVSVQFSDDDGATWAIYSTGILRALPTEDLTDISVAFSRSVISMITSEDAGGAVGRAEQWISRDLGHTAQIVGTEWNSAAGIVPSLISVVPTPSGKFVVLYFDTELGSFYRSFSYDSAQPAFLGDPGINQSAALTLASEAACVVWADEDGTLYVLLKSGGSGVTDRRVDLLRSGDQGATFEEYEAGPIDLNHSGAERLISWACASTGGRTAWLTRWDSPAPTSKRSLGVIWLGGSADHTFPTVRRETLTPRFIATTYLGFSRSYLGPSGGRQMGISWVPISLPDASAWTLASAGAPTIALVSPGVLNLSGVAADRVSYAFTDSNGQDHTEAIYVAGHFKITSGGSLASTEIGFRIRVSDFEAPSTNSTWEHAIELRFTTTALRIFDTVAGAAVGGDISHDFTTDTWIAVAIKGVAANTAELAIWIGDPTQPKRVLPLERISNSINTAGPGANQSKIEWGCISAATGAFDVSWSFVGGTTRTREFSLRDVNNWVSGWRNPDDVKGRDWSQVPALVFDDVRLSAEGGPAKSADEWKIETEYDFPISNIFPTEKPSPRQTWRSVTDNVDQLIVLDFEDDSVFTASGLLSSSLVLMVLNSNVRELQLQVQTGAGAFVTIATFRPREQVPDWRRAGRRVRPDETTTGAADIYFQRAQHVGDTMDLAPGAGSELHKIDVNRGGSWNTDGTGTAPQELPDFLLSADNLDGATPGSGTAADIWFRDWAGIVHEYAGTDHRFALFIPEHRTADGHYELGTVLLGDLLLLSHRFDRGYTVVREKNVEVFTRPDGMSRTRKRGPQVRQFEFGWSATAIPARNIQAPTPSPDWISMRDGGGGIPAGTPEAIIRDLEGLLEETDGAHIPIVYLHSLPQVDSPTTTDSLVKVRRNMTYGRIGTAPLTETPYARRGPGVDEVERLQALLLTEIP